jgi:uncharacterized cofD-like protein
MRLSNWFKHGVRVRRWILLGIIGLVEVGFFTSYVFYNIYSSILKWALIVALVISGGFCIYFSMKNVAIYFFNAVLNYGFRVSMNSDKLDSLMYEKRIHIKGPKIVAIGGGTGLSTMLRGLKLYSSNITAIVTVADDGGGSGILRQDLGMLPPGDIRNCILALANTEPIMQQLLQYRFKDGMLKGQSFGNLFLAAMDGISSSFVEAVRKMSDVLAVTGRVLPVTLDDIRLCAELEDGYVVSGEANIGTHNNTHNGRIKRVFLDPPFAKPLQEAFDAIMEADVIVLGPGSLYTSIIPNLLVDGVCEQISKSSALKVYVCNIMTQPGESEGYSVYDHIVALEKHSRKGIIDYCIVNTSDIPQELKKKYADDGAETVRVDYELIEKEGIKVIAGEFTSVRGSYVRHDSIKIAEAIIDLVAKDVLARDKKRIIDYYYAKDRLSKING